MASTQYYLETSCTLIISLDCNEHHENTAPKQSQLNKDIIFPTFDLATNTTRQIQTSRTLLAPCDFHISPFPPGTTPDTTLD